MQKLRTLSKMALEILGQKVENTLGTDLEKALNLNRQINLKKIKEDLTTKQCLARKKNRYSWLNLFWCLL